MIYFWNVLLLRHTEILGNWLYWGEDEETVRFAAYFRFDELAKQYVHNWEYGDEDAKIQFQADGYVRNSDGMIIMMAAALPGPSKNEEE